MKTAEEFLKEKGIKDTLYDVKNPEPNNWIKGGLSALLDEYRNQSHPTLPSDEEIRRNHVRKTFTSPSEKLAFDSGMREMRSLCEAKIAEMEREIEDLKSHILDLQIQLLSKD